MEFEIYSFEKLKSERTHENFSLINFTFPKSLSISELKNAVQDFEKILMNNLRKSDVICRSNGREFFVLLTNLKEVYDAESVYSRLINNFSEIKDNNNLRIGINLISNF